MIKLEYKGQAVLLTAQLATIYGTDIKNLQMNYLNHKDWFESGRHFFDLKGDELKAFKEMMNGIHQSQDNMKLMEAPDDEMLNIPLPTIGKQANAVKLWTRRGLIRHSHFLTTAAALQITERLEDVYFAMTNGELFELVKGLKASDVPEFKSVYVFEFDGKVKIGVSCDVEKRRRTLETGSGADIVRAWSSAPLDKAAAFEVERRAHEYFTDNRIKGEYFKVPFDAACEVVGKLST